MTWRSLSLALLLAPLTLTGCPPDNPDDSDVDTNEGTDDPGTDDPDSDDDTEEPSDINCHVLPTSLPPFAGAIEPASLASETPYTTDGGLDDVIAATTPATEDSVTVDIDVTSAIVTTLDFNAEYQDTGIAHRFFVEDAAGGVYVRLDFDTADGWPIAPGDEVSFTATSVRNFNGVMQVGALTDLVVVSSDNPVYVVEGNGQTLDTTGAINTVHHLFGELVTSGSECGSGWECFDLETRDGLDTNTSTFRIRNDRLTTPYIQGDCIDLYAPLSQFSGEPQFNINNFQWVRWIANVND